MPPRESTIALYQRCANLNDYVDEDGIRYEDHRITTMTQTELLTRLNRITNPLKLFIFFHRLGYRLDNNNISNCLLSRAECFNLQQAILPKLRRYGFLLDGRKGTASHLPGPVNSTLLTFEGLFRSLADGVGVSPQPRQAPTGREHRRPSQARVVEQQAEQRVTVARVQEEQRQERIHQEQQRIEATANAQRSATIPTRINTLKGGLMKPGGMLLCYCSNTTICTGVLCACWRIFDGEVGYCGISGKPETQKLKQDNIRTITREVQDAD